MQDIYFNALSCTRHDHAIPQPQRQVVVKETRLRAGADIQQQHIPHRAMWISWYRDADASCIPTMYIQQYLHISNAALVVVKHGLGRILTHHACQSARYHLSSSGSRLPRVGPDLSWPLSCLRPQFNQSNASAGHSLASMDGPICLTCSAVGSLRFSTTIVRSIRRGEKKTAWPGKRERVEAVVG